ncbi:MAG: hypothetical protein ACT4OZ_16405 [Gemmatimonadota bacterium]
MTRNRNALGTGTVFTAAGIAIPLLWTSANPIWVVVTLNFAMMALLVLQRSNMSDSITRFRQIVVQELGLPWYETLYTNREQHFVKEKRLLAKTVVEKILPELIDHIHEANGDVPIRIVLDSGTTITPLFNELVVHGVTTTRGQKVPAQIITNNLAGIEVVQKQESDAPMRLTEDDFTMLGGTPLSTYRATTGSVTELGLATLLAEKGHATIGIITANWLLIGKQHNTLSICAKGRGHKAFKALVAESCDHVLVVSPLGKILTQDSVGEVHRLMQTHARGERRSDETYEAVTFDPSRKERTILVTTRRPSDSNSPLRVLSSQLFGLPARNRTNFTLAERSPGYAPFGSDDEVRNIELPHHWTRRCTDELFDEVE